MKIIGGTWFGVSVSTLVSSISPQAACPTWSPTHHLLRPLPAPPTAGQSTPHCYWLQHGEMSWWEITAHLTLTPGGDDCFLSLHRPTVNPGLPVLEGRWHFCLLKPNLPISEWYSGAELHFRADTPRTEAELTPPFALSRKCCGIHTYTHSCNYTVFLRINNPYNKSPCWGARCVMMVMGRRREEKSSRQIIIRNVCAGPQSSPLTSTICGAQTGNCFSERERELLCCSGSY